MEIVSHSFEPSPGVESKRMRAGAQIVASDMRGEVPTIWTVEDESAQPLSFRFVKLKNGQVGDISRLRHVATFLVRFEDLHLFIDLEPIEASGMKVSVGHPKD